MVVSWHELEAFLVGEAATDLAATGEVAPALVAFAGATPRFAAWLRPFERGAYHDPLIELLALAGPLDSDRLMLTLGGRMWATDQPVPVDDHGDRRRRAVVVHAVDGAHGDPHATAVLHPFHFDPAGEPVFERRWDPGPVSSWISEALVATVRGRDRLRAPWPDIAAQAARVEQLGHALVLPPDVATLLADAASTAAE